MRLDINEKYYKFCPNCKTKLQRKPIHGLERLFCPKCDFVFWNNPKPSTSIILSHQGKVLMLKRARNPLKGYWVLPGGYLEYGEKPEDGIRRETKEEIGKEVKVEKLVGVYLDDNDPRGISVDITYSGKGSLKVTLSEEHDEFEYFPLDKLPDKIAYQQREAISDWAKAI